MLRETLLAMLNRVRREYAQLACATTNAVVFNAAYSAAKSVELTADRVAHPRTYEQQRRPGDYVAKRLADISVRFNRKLAGLSVVNASDLRSAASELREVLEHCA